MDPLLLILPVVVLACLWALERKDRRHTELVERLCQRIQAPEQAVLDHTASLASSDEPLFVPVDDDEAWRDLREGQVD